MNALLLVVALAGAPLDVVYVSPGCPSGGSGYMNLVGELFDHFASNPGSLTFTTGGMYGLTHGGHLLLPEGDAPAFDGVRAVVAEPAGSTTEVLAESVPVLVSPYEVLFAWPYVAHDDWLAIIERQVGPGRRYPDARRVNARLLRHHRGALDVLELVLADGSSERPTDVLAWTPGFAGRARLDTDDYHGWLYMMATPVGRGSALKARLDAVRGDGLVLYPGGVVGENVRVEQRAYCAAAVAAFGPAALVPRGDELGLGPAALGELAHAHGLAYVAANLVETAGGTRPFPRYLMMERAGVSVAVVGLVGRDQLRALPASVRAQWRIEEPSLALEKVLEALRGLPAPPAVTVLLVAAEGDDLHVAVSAHNVDLVVGDFTGDDDRPLVRTVALEQGLSRYAEPLFAVHASGNGVGRVRLELDGTPPRVVGGEEREWPVLAGGPVDPAFERAFREHEDAWLRADAEVLLPDPTAAVVASADLGALVWGDQILHRHGFRRYAQPLPARFSDPLWMRFVTNLMLAELDADVALSRNLTRTSDIIGALQRDVLRSWLQSADSVVLVELTGADLMNVAEALRRQQHAGAVPPDAWVFAAGIDPERMWIRGRPLDLRERYRVVATDSALDLPALAALGARARVDRFTGMHEDDAGGPLLLRDLVLRVIEREASELGAASPERAGRLALELADHSREKTAQWRLVVDELSLSGSWYANSGNVEVLAATRETRVSTPDNYQIGVRANAATVYDDDALAWETRLRGVLSRAVLLLDGVDVPPQEQADDVVASTELRLNAVQLAVGTEGVPLVPFVQVAYDTELTATPDSADPTVNLPLQKLGRASLGVVAYPGPRLREVRLAGLYQVDLGSGPARHDGGLGAGAKLRLPLVDPMFADSTLELRWLVPDGDDVAADIGLVLQGNLRLVLPFSEAASVFVFGDGYGAAGKTPATRELAGSFILGAGLDFASLFKP